MAKVLIVDDADALRESLRFVLSRLGHSVRTAADGREALRLIKEEMPDLLVTDVFMPEKDGFEIIQEARRLSPSLPIIAMTGGLHGDFETFLKMAKRLGVNATISKPFSVQEFQAVVDKVLGGKA